jgi:hypothetical protein
MSSLTINREHTHPSMTVTVCPRTERAKSAIPARIDRRIEVTRSVGNQNCGSNCGFDIDNDDGLASTPRSYPLSDKTEHRIPNYTESDHSKRWPRYPRKASAFRPDIYSSSTTLCLNPYSPGAESFNLFTAHDQGG